MRHQYSKLIDVAKETVNRLEASTVGSVGEVEASYLSGAPPGGFDSLYA